MGSWPGGYGLEILYPPSEENFSIEIDLVFIHGLNGDPAHTWHAKDINGNDVCWLSARSFLPNRFPRARIITFKYNSRVLHYKSDAKVENIASSLLAQLEAKRNQYEERQRPLVFICHSLGGLVVKKALTLHERVPERMQIQSSTKGIIFLATPHQGSELASSLKRLSFLIDSPRHLADILSTRSQSLQVLNQDFKLYYEGRQNNDDPVHIASFREMFRTYAIPYLLGATVVKADCATALLSNEVVFDVHENHRSICRFASPENPTFDQICKHLQKMVDEIPIRRPSADLGRQRSKYHDLPLATDPFIGRSEDLEWLNATWCPNDRKQPEIVVLRGLGMMGKTQLALHYAHLHPLRYHTMKRFNARSEQDLQSSLSSFFDYLVSRKDERFKVIADPNRKDKWNAVLQWFEQESNFLLIYDDIELEPYFDLRKYLPRSPNGHYILISHNPEVTSFGTGKSREIQKMKDADAIKLLLVRSETHYESQIEMERDALPICSVLDYTPGLIEIAAKYILVNGISLKQYRERVDEWKCNIRQGIENDIFGNAFDSLALALRSLEQETASMRLLKLFAFLDGSEICSLLLHRASSPCLRWAKTGEPTELAPNYDSAEGTSPSLLELLREGKAFDSAISPLVNMSFLRREPTEAGSRIEFPQMIQDLVRRSLSPAENLHWKRTAIRLVSHALPEEPNLDPEFETVRAKLSPHVFRAIEHANESKPDQLSEVLTDLIGMLLSTVARSGNELDLLASLVAQIDDGYYRCQVAKWHAYKDFFGGKRDEAEKILAKAQADEESRIQRDTDCNNARTYGALGDLIMHRMQFLFMQRNFDKGEQVLKRWQSRFNSTFEHRVAVYIDTAHAKMLVARGNLEEALECLKQIVEQPLESTTGGAVKSSDLNWATVILSQIYCYRGDYDKVISLLQPRVGSLLEKHSQCEFITSDFRILLCEAYLGSRQFDTAAEELKSLSEDLRLPGQAGNPRSHDQEFKVKVLRARLAHMQQQWRDAVERWIAVIGFLGVKTPDDITNKKFERTERTVVTLYSLGVARYRLGDKKRGKEYVSMAEEEPDALKHPEGKIDYTHWSKTVQEEYCRVSHSRMKSLSCL